MPCSGRCAPRSSPCPTTWPSTRRMVPGRSARPLSGSARTTTIGTERATNPLLSIDDEDRFVATLLDGLGQLPHLLPPAPEINRRGPRLYAERPRPSPGSTSTRSAGTSRMAPRSSTPGPSASSPRRTSPGSLSIEHRSVFASWFGWLVPLDRPVVFVLDDTTDRADLVRQCLTVGHEAILGELDGGIATWTAAGLPVESIPLVDPADMAGTVLDVRQDNEWAAGHLPGAIHVELGDLADAPRCPAAR